MTVDSRVRQRFHDLLITEQKCQTRRPTHSHVYSIKYSHRTINDWNRLSNDRVNASSENMFKNNIEKFVGL